MKECNHPTIQNKGNCFGNDIFFSRYSRTSPKDTISSDKDPPKIQDINATICNLSHLIACSRPNNKHLLASPEALERTSNMLKNLVKQLFYKIEILETLDRNEEIVEITNSITSFVKGDKELLPNDKKEVEDLIKANGKEPARQDLEPFLGDKENNKEPIKKISQSQQIKKELGLVRIGNKGKEIGYYLKNPKNPNLSTKDLAELFGVSRAYVDKIKKKLNLPLIKNNKRTKTIDCLNSNPESKDISTKDLAELIGVSIYTIYRVLKELNLTKETKSEKIRKYFKDNPNDDTSITDLAEKLGVNPGLIKDIKAEKAKTPPPAKISPNLSITNITKPYDDETEKYNDIKIELFNLEKTI